MIVETIWVREAGFFSNPARTNLSVPSVIVGMIDNPALRIAFSGSVMGILGLAGA